MLQCYDAVGWVTGRVLGVQKPVPLILRDSFPKQVEKEGHGGTG